MNPNPEIVSPKPFAAGGGQNSNGQLSYIVTRHGTLLLLLQPVSILLAASVEGSAREARSPSALSPTNVPACSAHVSYIHSLILFCFVCLLLPPRAVGIGAAKPTTHCHGSKRPRNFTSTTAYELDPADSDSVELFLRLLSQHKPNANASCPKWLDMEIAWNSLVLIQSNEARSAAIVPRLRRTTAALLHAFSQRSLDNVLAAASTNCGPAEEVTAFRSLRAHYASGGSSDALPLALAPPPRLPPPPLADAPPHMEGADPKP